MSLSTRSDPEVQKTAELSILIVSWNCKRMLADCLDSLRDQLSSYRHEIIVVDNASSDGTSEMIRRNYPDVVFLESGANLGFARGNNLALAVTHGKYIFLINPDVVVVSDCFRSMLQYLEEHREVGMMGPQIVGSDGGIQRSCMREPTLWNQLCRALALDRFATRSRTFAGYLMGDFQHDAIREVEILNGCFWLVRREALQQVGPLDDRFWMYGEDLDWCRRFRAAGWKIVFFPEAQTVHYGGGSSKQASLFCYVQMQRADLQYWRKYHGLLSCWCYWALLWFANVWRAGVVAILYFARRSRNYETRLRLKRHLACVRHLYINKYPSDSQ
jgi:GT2 family glycosyltransferase